MPLVVCLLIVIVIRVGVRTPKLRWILYCLLLFCFNAIAIRGGVDYENYKIGAESESWDFYYLSSAVFWIIVRFVAKFSFGFESIDLICTTFFPLLLYNLRRIDKLEIFPVLAYSYPFFLLEFNVIRQGLGVLLFLFAVLACYGLKRISIFTLSCLVHPSFILFSPLVILSSSKMVCVRKEAASKLAARRFLKYMIFMIVSFSLSLALFLFKPTNESGFSSAILYLLVILCIFIFIFYIRNIRVDEVTYVLLFSLFIFLINTGSNSERMLLSASLLMFGYLSKYKPKSNRLSIFAYCCTVIYALATTPFYSVYASALGVQFAYFSS